MKPKNKKKLQDRKIIMVDMLLITDSLGIEDKLEDILNDWDDSELSIIFGEDVKEFGCETDEELNYFIQEKYTGKFLVEVQTPVRKYKNSKTAYTYSWGYKSYTLLMGDDLDEIAEKAVKWADDKIELWKKEPTF